MKVYVIHVDGLALVPGIFKTREGAEKRLVELSSEWTADRHYILEYEVQE
jgi:hypothetical protein